MSQWLEHMVETGLRLYPFEYQQLERENILGQRVGKSKLIYALCMHQWLHQATMKALSNPNRLTPLSVATRGVREGRLGTLEFARDLFEAQVPHIGNAFKVYEARMAAAAPRKSVELIPGFLHRPVTG